MFFFFFPLCVLSSDSRNAAVMHTVGLLPKLLFQLSDPAVTLSKVKIISCVVASLLKTDFTSQDMSRYSVRNALSSVMFSWISLYVKRVLFVCVDWGSFLSTHSLLLMT